eukprot:1579345-Prymnesium_polylepis.2
MKLRMHTCDDGTHGNRKGARWPSETDVRAIISGVLPRGAACAHLQEVNVDGRVAVLAPPGLHVAGAIAEALAPSIVGVQLARGRCKLHARAKLPRQPRLDGAHLPLEVAAEAVAVRERGDLSSGAKCAQTP